MGRLGLAFRVFFDVLFHVDKAAQVRTLIEDSEAAKSSPHAEPKTQADAPIVEAPKAPTPAKVTPAVTLRSDALTLLESLQREARFLDFIQEDLSTYQDVQIGQAAREVHRGTKAVLDRFFQIVPASTEQEGAKITLNGQESAADYRLVGKVIETRPVTGVLVHPGWKALKTDLPVWTGHDSCKLVLAPAEVELS